MGIAANMTLDFQKYDIVNGKGVGLKTNTLDRDYQACY